MAQTARTVCVDQILHQSRVYLNIQKVSSVPTDAGFLSTTTMFKALFGGFQASAAPLKISPLIVGVFLLVGIHHKKRLCHPHSNRLASKTPESALQMALLTKSCATRLARSPKGLHPSQPGGCSPPTSPMCLPQLRLFSGLDGNPRSGPAGGHHKGAAAEAAWVSGNSSGFPFG